MTCAVRLAHAVRLTIASNVAALAVPSLAADGVAIPAAWAIAPIAGKIRKLVIGILGNALGARTLTDVQVYVYDGTNWWSVGRLNGGNDVVLEATAGTNFEINDVSAYSRIAVSSDSITGGNADVYATPMIESDVAAE
jgi:hypothetical protein